MPKWQTINPNLLQLVEEYEVCKQFRFLEEISRCIYVLLGMAIVNSSCLTYDHNLLVSTNYAFFNPPSVLHADCGLRAF